MIIGHSGSLLTWWIFGWHIPIFFVLWGVLISNRKQERFSHFVKHQSKSLLLPYIKLSLINLVLYIPIAVRLGNHKDYWLYVMSLFLSNTNLQVMVGWTPLWFIPCMFLARIFFYLVEYFMPKKIGFLAVFILAYVTSRFTTHIPWHANTAVAAALFIYVGYWSGGYWGATKKSDNKRRMICAMLMIFLSSVIIRMNGIVDMNSSLYGNYFLLFFLAASTMSVGILILVKCSTLGRIWLFQFLGRHSLLVMGYNQIINIYVHFFTKRITTDLHIEALLIIAADLLTILILGMAIDYVRKNKGCAVL